MTERFWLLRVYEGVKHSFPMRWLEWVMAGLMVGWGIGFLGIHYDPIAGKGVAWHTLFFFAPQAVWSVVMASLGVLRLGALTINGTFRDTFYDRFSPIVRGMTAGLCGSVWFIVSLSYLSAGAQSGLTYSAIFIIESFIAYFVLGEAGDNLRAHYGRKSRR